MKHVPHQGRCVGSVADPVPLAIYKSRHRRDDGVVGILFRDARRKIRRFRMWLSDRINNTTFIVPDRARGHDRTYHIERLTLISR